MTSKTYPTIAPWKRVSSLVLAMLVLMCFPASAQTPPVPVKPDASAPTKVELPPPPPLFESWKIYLDSGVRNFDLYGDHPGKILENRDITNGFFVNGAGIRYEAPKSPYSFSFEASNVHELDATIRM